MRRPSLLMLLAAVVATGCLRYYPEDDPAWDPDGDSPDAGARPQDESTQFRELPIGAWPRFVREARGPLHLWVATDSRVWMRADGQDSFAERQPPSPLSFQSSPIQALSTRGGDAVVLARDAQAVSLVELPFHDAVLHSHGHVDGPVAEYEGTFFGAGGAWWRSHSSATWSEVAAPAGWDMPFAAFPGGMGVGVVARNTGGGLSLFHFNVNDGTWGDALHLNDPPTAGLVAQCVAVLSMTSGNVQHWVAVVLGPSRDAAPTKLLIAPRNPPYQANAVTMADVPSDAPAGPCLGGNRSVLGDGLVAFSDRLWNIGHDGSVLNERMFVDFTASAAHLDRGVANGAIQPKRWLAGRHADGRFGITSVIDPE